MPMRNQRRSKGEGSIKLRADGRWEAQIRLEIPVQSGNYKRRSCYGKTKLEVSRKIAEIKQKHENKLLVQGKHQSLAQYLKGWWHDTDLKLTSLASRQLNVRRVSNIIGDVRLDQVTAGHIRQVDNALKRNGLSGSSRRQAFVLLRTALKAAAMDGDIPFSPFSRVDWRPKAELHPKRILTMAEKAKLFAINDEWTPLWQILLATGMRSGEVLGLTWDKIDLDGGRLHIHQSIHRTNGGYRLDVPKTVASYRTLALRPVVGEVFKKIKACQEAEEQRLEGAWKTNCKNHPLIIGTEEHTDCTQFVFTRELGLPVLGHSAYHRLKTALTSIKAPPARVHDLRHTFASDQLLAGTPMSEVSRMMGHVSVAFTLKIYTHIVDEVQDKAAEAAANMLEEAMRMAQLQVAGNLEK